MKFDKKGFVTYTNFGKTRRVKATLLNMEEGEEPEKFIWVERDEDWYGTWHETKKVAIVDRKDWLDAAFKEEMDALRNR